MPRLITLRSLSERNWKRPPSSGGGDAPRLLSLNEESSNPAYGRPPEERPIEELLETGVICIDKPAGPTSHQVAEIVKNILHAKKTGHAGTLDPIVTGLLVIGVNEGTKVLKAQLEAPKEYICLMRVHKAPTDSEVKNVLKEFTGQIFQRPPVRAAVSRVLRVREIYSNELLEHDKKNVLFKTSCEAGTYIRRLCHDMGLALGSGAHMQQLRRMKSGAFSEKDIATLHDLADAYAYWEEDKNEKPLRKIIQPMENGLSHLPKVVISDFAVPTLAHGAQLAIPGILQISNNLKKGDLVAAFTQKGEGVMIATALMSAEEIQNTEKGIAFKTERILIKPDVYPKLNKKQPK